MQGHPAVTVNAHWDKLEEWPCFCAFHTRLLSQHDAVAEIEHGFSSAHNLAHQNNRRHPLHDSFTMSRHDDMVTIRDQTLLSEPWQPFDSVGCLFETDHVPTQASLPKPLSPNPVGPTPGHTGLAHLGFVDAPYIYRQSALMFAESTVDAQHGTTPPVVLGGQLDGYVPSRSRPLATSVPSHARHTAQRSRPGQSGSRVGKRPPKTSVLRSRIACWRCQKYKKPVRIGPLYHFMHYVERWSLTALV